MPELITQENIDKIYNIIANNNGMFSSSEILDYVKNTEFILHSVTQPILNLLVSRNKIFLKNGKYFLKGQVEKPLMPLNQKAEDLISIIKNLKLIPLRISERAKYSLSQPIDSYIKFTLPNLDLKNESLRTKLFNYLDFSENTAFESFNFLDADEIVNNIIENIKVANSKGYFPDLTTKDCRYLFLSTDFLIETKYENLRIQLFDYINHLDKIKTRLFKAILFAYFKSYYQLSTDEPFINFLDEVKNKYFYGATYIQKSLIGLKNQDITSSYYCKKVALKVLDEFLLSDLSLKDCIKNHNNLIVQGMEIFDEIMKEIGILCLEKINERLYLDLLLNEVFKFNFQKSQMDELLSEVLRIYGDGKKNIDASIQKTIQLSILNNPNYGDPRLYPLKWNNVKKESKQIFISWLAKEDLEFFFNIMFKNSIDVHNRKSFWEQYINSEELQYSKVILSNIAATDPAVKKAEAEGRKFAKFSNSTDGSSCFILAFKTAYIVEFSEAGNALYFYDKDTPDIRMDELKYPSVASLKKSNAPESTKTRLINPDFSEYKCFRVRHIEGWQIKVKDILSRNLGIYQGEQ